MIQALTAWGPAVLWAAVLFLLSSDPDPFGATFRFPLPGLDKVVHLILYGVLGSALAWGRERGDGGQAQGGRPPHALLVLLGTLYGVTDEWHQSHVPGRVPSGWDLVADVCGVALGYAAFQLLSRRGSRSPSGAS